MLCIQIHLQKPQVILRCLLALTSDILAFKLISTRNIERWIKHKKYKGCGCTATVAKVQYKDIKVKCRDVLLVYKRDWIIHYYKCICLVHYEILFETLMTQNWAHYGDWFCLDNEYRLELVVKTTHSHNCFLYMYHIKKPCTFPLPLSHFPAKVILCYDFKRICSIVLRLSELSCVMITYSGRFDKYDCKDCLISTICTLQWKIVYSSYIYMSICEYM